jgi:hypothetical protein
VPFSKIFNEIFISLPVKSFYKVQGHFTVSHKSALSNFIQVDPS